MTSTKKQQLIDFIRDNGTAGPSQIAVELQISPQMVHRHLKRLLQENRVRKLGRPPKVLYQVLETQIIEALPALAVQLESYVNEFYLTVKPNGEVLKGLEGFNWWALKTNQYKHYQQLAQEYVTQHTKLTTQYRNDQGLIDATFKIVDTFKRCFLNAMYYQEFYSLPKFGKTRTGQLVFLGKSGQDIDAIRELANFCRDSISNVIKQHKIDAVIFTPHSIPRKVSFLKEFKTTLSIAKPTIEMIKVFSGKAPIPQKSLQKLVDRIENADTTIFLKDHSLSYKRVLVIDDAVGSGATLNAIAEKLKAKGATFVCGFAVTGSLKGFEVLNEI